MPTRNGVLANYEYPDPKPIGEWLDEHARTHPGFKESLIPVWGSAREAVADAYDGDYAGAVGNGVLAAADLVPGLAGGKTIARTLAYAKKFPRAASFAKEGAASWGKVSPWMHQPKKGVEDAVGYLEKNQHGHHWLIPNNEGWGKQVPDWIKNQPWNIKPMDRVTHGRIHHKMTVDNPAVTGGRETLPKFSRAEAAWRGTPEELKVAGGVLAGHGTLARKAQVDKNKK